MTYLSKPLRTDLDAKTIAPLRDLKQIGCVAGHAGQMLGIEQET